MNILKSKAQLRRILETIQPGKNTHLRCETKFSADDIMECMAGLPEMRPGVDCEITHWSSEVHTYIHINCVQINFIELLESKLKRLGLGLSKLTAKGPFGFESYGLYIVFKQKILFGLIPWKDKTLAKITQFPTYDNCYDAWKLAFRIKVKPNGTQADFHLLETLVSDISQHKIKTEIIMENGTW